MMTIPPTKNRSRMFTFLMVAVNVAIFVYSMYRNEWRFESFSDNPTFGPSSTVLEDLGAKDAGKIRAGQWWRLIMAAFLHSGLLHIIFNVHMIWRLGGTIERGFGSWRFAVLYLISGISGNLTSSLFLPLQIGVGASGALFGLIGSLFSDFLHNHRLMAGSSIGYLLNLLINAALGIAIGLLPIIDNFAHIGGFVCGFLLGGTLLVDPNHVNGHRMKTRPWYSAPFRLISSILLVVWFTSLSWAFVTESDPDRFCSWCHYANCVESPWWTCCVPKVDRTTGVLIPC